MKVESRTPQLKLSIISVVVQASLARAKNRSSDFVFKSMETATRREGLRDRLLVLLAGCVFSSLRFAVFQLVPARA
jgi:hypothetical protein